MITLEMTILISGVVVCAIILVCWTLMNFRVLSRHVKQMIGGDIEYAEALPAISVIVYASNDGQNLVDYLPYVLEQDYPEYEVIVVIDSSTDTSKNIISRMMTEYNNLYQTFVPRDTCNLSRKKLSITLGLKAAKHDIIVCTAANCTSQSNQWLRMMARNFTPDTDIVIGYSHNDYSTKSGKKCFFIAYDSLMSAVQYLTYAISKRTYRGDGNNLAYRKRLFFDNKGFSGSLNLHFGDDDLFINSVANKENTRVEISHESQLITHYDDIKSSHDELKLRYDFTARYLRTNAMTVWGVATIIYYVFNLLVIAGAILFYNNIIVMATILPLWLIVATIHIIGYRKSATILQAPKLLVTVPLFTLFRPLVNFNYKIKGYFTRKSNYTWQRRK